MNVEGTDIDNRQSFVQQGQFASKGKYPVYIYISNGPRKKLLAACNVKSS